MSQTHHHEAPWYTPTIVMRLADGSTLLKPGRPIQRATGDQVAKWTGVSLKTLRNLAETGFIRRAQITRVKHLYYPGEVEDFIAATEADPDFWDDVRKKAYLDCRSMRSRKPTTPPQP